MTVAKIAITLPREQLAHVQRAVKQGAASSVSGYITRVLSEERRRESLKVLLDELIAQHGAPTPKEVAWAKSALSRRRRV